ncbi:hypothetical protein XTGART29_3059 [Xanthomonas translucens pv. graminis ART-Xtg29]|nr:hypothetical protein XTGART29_3059 [Xanthomonas translucens pv. graminis ART-Xtg29]
MDWACAAGRGAQCHRADVRLLPGFKPNDVLADEGEGSRVRGALIDCKGPWRRSHHAVSAARRMRAWRRRAHRPRRLRCASAASHTSRSVRNAYMSISVQDDVQHPVEAMVPVALLLEMTDEGVAGQCQRPPGTQERAAHIRRWWRFGQFCRRAHRPRRLRCASAASHTSRSVRNAYMSISVQDDVQHPVEAMVPVALLLEMTDEGVAGQCQRPPGTQERAAHIRRWWCFGQFCRSGFSRDALPVTSGRG